MDDVEDDDDDDEDDDDDDDDGEQDADDEHGGLDDATSSVVGQRCIVCGAEWRLSYSEPAGALSLPKLARRWHSRSREASRPAVSSRLVSSPQSASRRPSAACSAPIQLWRSNQSRRKV